MDLLSAQRLNFLFSSGRGNKVIRDGSFCFVILHFEITQYHDLVYNSNRNRPICFNPIATKGSRSLVDETPEFKEKKTTPSHM